MSHIQISNTCVFAVVLVKPFIAVLVLYRNGVLVLWGVPYIGWVWMCMGLTMAGACAKHWPCYWSQTNGFEGMCMSRGKFLKPWQVTDKIIE